MLLADQRDWVLFLSDIHAGRTHDRPIASSAFISPKANLGMERNSPRYGHGNLLQLAQLSEPPTSLARSLYINGDNLCL
jgi:hypothetical protein